MSSDLQLLRSIPDAKPVRVFIPITGKTERYRVSSILRKTNGAAFQLLFQAGVLPTDAIDTTQTCLVTVDMGGPNVSIEARVTRIINEQALEMGIVKSVSHEQMREFFRVDATTSVISSSFHLEFFGQQGKPWSIKGRTIDISGSGILALFTEPVPEDKQVKLEIALSTDNDETITTLAHPVRSMKIAENHYEVAYQFDDISTEDRDKIIGYCLIVQRKHLRLKVQVRDADKL